MATACEKCIPECLKNYFSQRQSLTKKYKPKINSHDFSGHPRLLSGITSRSSIFLSLLLLASAKWSFENVIFKKFFFRK
jgi:hypothetical protein